MKLRNRHSDGAHADRRNREDSRAFSLHAPPEAFPRVLPRPSSRVPPRGRLFAPRILRRMLDKIQTLSGARSTSSREETFSGSLTKLGGSAWHDVQMQVDRLPATQLDGLLRRPAHLSATYVPAFIGSPRRPPALVCSSHPSPLLPSSPSIDSASCRAVCLVPLFLCL
eukprot:6203543-Pleurochrysis_carterae.AAC.4